MTRCGGPAGGERFKQGSPGYDVAYRLPWSGMLSMGPFFCQGPMS